MYKGKQVIDFMEESLGNRGAQARAYCGLAAGQPWCNAEVSYALYKNGVKDLYCNGRKETFCPHSIQWCYNNLADIPIYLALPGDVVYFDWELNGTPNHIGFARQRVSDLQLDTVEGNTSGGKVANKTRDAKYIQAVFRLHYPVDKSEFDTSKKLEIDGLFGFNSIACLQKALMVKQDGILGKATVKALQKIAGTTADGSWGTKTTKAVQKMVGVKVDGFCGPKTVKGLQKWINKMNSTAVTKPAETKPVATKPATQNAKKTAQIHKNICKWWKKIAKSKKYHYVRWKDNDSKTHNCPICKKYTDYAHKGGNCIWWIIAGWHHGGKIPCNCNCHVFGNDIGTKMWNASKKEALKIAQRQLGIKDIMLIRNDDRSVLKASQLEPGDACFMFVGTPGHKGFRYKHMTGYVGNGKITDNTGGRNPNIKYGSSYASYCKTQPCRMAVRYTGTGK